MARTQIILVIAFLNLHAFGMAGIFSRKSSTASQSTASHAPVVDDPTLNTNYGISGYLMDTVSNWSTSIYNYNNDVMTMRNFLQFLDSPDKQQTAVLGIRQSSSLERHLDAYLDILSRNQKPLQNQTEVLYILKIAHRIQPHLNEDRFLSIANKWLQQVMPILNTFCLENELAINKLTQDTHLGHLIESIETTIVKLAITKNEIGRPIHLVNGMQMPAAKVPLHGKFLSKFKGRWRNPLRQNSHANENQQPPSPSFLLLPITERQEILQQTLYYEIVDLLSTSILYGNHHMDYDEHLDICPISNILQHKGLLNLTSNSEKLQHLIRLERDFLNIYRPICAAATQQHPSNPHSPESAKELPPNLPIDQSTTTE